MSRGKYARRAAARREAAEQDAKGSNYQKDPDERALVVFLTAYALQPMDDRRTTDAKAWLREFLGQEGENQGRVRLALARNGDWDELRGFRADRPPFAGLVADHVGMLDALASSLVKHADQGYDVFACPYLHEGGRRQGGALVRRHVHADIDGPLDLQLVADLGAMAVASGGRANSGEPRGHVYVRLSESVGERDHKILCAALGQQIGRDHWDTTKTGDADVLRPPGTLNHKTDPPRPVTWLIRPDEDGVQTWEPEALAQQLGIVWPLPQPQPRPEQPEHPVILDLSGDETLQHRLDGLVRSVEDAPTKHGNDRLNWAAYKAGALLADASAELADQTRERLIQAYLARRTPHTRAEAESTVRSGWTRGAADPVAALGDEENSVQLSIVAPAPTPPAPAPPPTIDPIRGGIGRLQAMPDDSFIGKEGLQVRSAAECIQQSIPYGWSPLDGHFYVYDAGLWRRGDELIDQAIFALLGERYRITLEGHLRKALQRLPNVRRVSAEPIEEDRWINTRNGLVEWMEGRLYPHLPESCGMTQLPVEWSADAKCPAFTEFLTQVLPEDCWQPSEQCPAGFIWEVIGYALYSGNPMQVAFMLIGGGGNGKGRFLHVLEALAGRANTSSVGLHEVVENRFRAATLYGKLLNIAGDLDPKWLENTATFKKLTGGDSVQAEHKFGHPFDFTPWATPFYSVNKPFGSADTSEGYWRRWIVLPFPYDHAQSKRTADQIDKANTMPGELSGILRRAVDALPTLMDRGRFFEPESVREAKEEFRIHADRVLGWLKECARLVPTVPFTPRKVLYESFSRFTEDDHGKVMRATEFYARLEQMPGIRRTTRNGVRGFRGITLRSGGGQSHEEVH